MASLPKFATKLHVFVYRASGGRLVGSFKGAPVLILTTTGSKTGLERNTPLLFLKDGEALVVVASNGGSDRAPSWLSNLKANPAAAAQVRAEHRSVRAHVASPTERERLFPKVVALYPPYQDYQARTDREIPLVVLEPAT